MLCFLRCSGEVGGCGFARFDSDDKVERAGEDAREEADTGVEVPGQFALASGCDEIDHLAGDEAIDLEEASARNPIAPVADLLDEAVCSPDCLLFRSKACCRGEGSGSGEFGKECGEGGAELGEASVRRSRVRIVIWRDFSSPEAWNSTSAVDWSQRWIRSLLSASLRRLSAARRRSGAEIGHSTMGRESRLARRL